MDEQTRSDMQAWSRRWNEARNDLVLLERREAAEIDLARVLLDLTEAYRDALRACPPQPTSGLIEQQRWFSRFACKT